MSEGTILLLWFSGSIFWGLLGALMGSKRDYTAAGFLVGFIFWFIGLILTYSSRFNEKQCPFCYSYIHYKATICPNCREHQPVVEADIEEQNTDLADSTTSENN